MVYVKQTGDQKNKKAFFLNGKTDPDYLFLGRIVEHGINVNDMENEEGYKIDIAEAYFAIKNKNEIMDKIVRVLNAGDAVALRSLFSESAKSKTIDLDNQITACLAFFMGEVTSFFQDTYWTNPDDDVLAGEWLIGEYTLRNKSGNYRLRYDYVEQGNPEEIGLRRLEIGSIDFYRHSANGMMIRHWQYTDKEAGIYIASFEKNNA
jgi:predicted SnoaL-like aldol condensation-catalyzing enzyme